MDGRRVQIGNTIYSRAADGYLTPIATIPAPTPKAKTPDGKAGMLDYYLGGTGIPERLRAVNNIFNPVEAVGQSMVAAQGMFAPNATGWDRVQAAGDMLSGAASVLPLGKIVGASDDLARGALRVEGAVQDFATDEFGGVGFRAYHGSPHDFDRFSLDKIGTGEGAQAYGHGLYFAESEGVAKSYRDAGLPPYQGNQVQQAVFDAIRANGNDDALDALNRAYLDALRNGDTWGARIHQDAVNNFDEIRGKLPGGHMYEVQINADPNDFLDWDKPLSEQPAAIRALASNAPLDGATGPTKAKLRAFQSGAENPSMGIVATGQDLHRALAAYGENSPAATEAFRSAGIPGIRYLDAGSRGAGDGSRNYVVFDDKLIEIIRKYGWAAVAPLLAGANAPSAEAGILPIGQQ